MATYLRAAIMESVIDMGMYLMVDLFIKEEAAT